MVNAIALPPGSVLDGKYRIERELGSGGMGVVVEATHLALGQRVAIKLLNPELAGAEENVARFLREAQVAAMLPSEHIARVSDVGQTLQGSPYLVMEMLDGHDLAVELARAGRLAVGDAVDWILQACEGVADAHAAGLVHRDLKPANLFLARRPNRPPILKVLDFGLTKQVRGREDVSLTQTGSVFGTPQYMSPEQVLSSKNVDARCDQHALAMILFEALTGRPPYEGAAASQLFVIIATAAPPSARALRVDVPRGLDAAIRRALAKKPEERFPSLAGLAAAIAPFGGPLAREMADNVRRVLAAGARADVAPAEAQASLSARTLTRGPEGGAPRAALGSEGDLTSSMDPTRRTRRARRFAVTAGAAAVVLGAALLLVSRRGGSSAPAGGASASASAEASAEPERAAEASPVAVAPASAPPPAVAPEPSVSAARPPPSAAPRATTPRTAPRSPVRSALGVFGGKR
jgi:serine/threonine-protein kinase